MNRLLERVNRMAPGEHGRHSERRATKVMGGRATPASGALSGAKGDATIGDFLFEMKATKTQTLAVKLAWLRKISHEAEGIKKIPALLISFVTPAGKLVDKDSEWVAMPRTVFEKLTKGE